MNRDDIGCVRVRFAPSPTGYLHIGGLRTALFNWLFARHYNGLFLVRIEDTDLERSRSEYTESIVDALSWTGITSDEPLVIQSERRDYHAQLAHQLLSQGKAYRCFCPARENSEFVDNHVIHDCHCRNLIVTKENLLKPFVLRFRVPDDLAEISFNDKIHGQITFKRGQLDDFIIVRSDGSPTYNFVVVADDAAMRITHVIRGEDHISNTPKQILLYKACGFVLPEFAHVPMILGSDGQRLSKRHAATSVL